MPINYKEKVESIPSPSVKKYLTAVLPRVSKEIKRWIGTVETRCDNLELRKQALSSLNSKRFHAQGGSFFALYNPAYVDELTKCIVALQTISDYLDNLCDRAGVQNEAAFRCLHLAMLDALDFSATRDQDEYYRFFPHKNDGGYLCALVEECRHQLKQLPSYHLVQKRVIDMASMYNDLQVYKHLHPSTRRARLKKWFRNKGSAYLSRLHWWEFSAACGSTLGIFSLLALSTQEQLNEKEVQQHLMAYFPWICGLHILLDYYIDQEEDLRQGDLNFASCYESPGKAEERLLYFYRKAVEKTVELPYSRFHQTIIKGLLAVYLSDTKAEKALYQSSVRRILKTGGGETIMLHRLGSWLRKTGIL